MRYRTFGRTGLSVSEIGFGCGPTAGLMLNGDAGVRRRAVEHAISRGINYFDTAAAYGEGRSEKNLGAALAELSARAIVASKVTLEWPDLDDIPGAVEKSVAGSLERLGLERLDIVHLHNRIGAARAPRSPYGSGALISVGDALGSRGVAETLRRLQAQGRVGVVGCCGFGGEREPVSRIIESDAFASVIVNYSVLNATAWHPAPVDGQRDYAAVGARAARREMGVVALRVLEGGVLAGFDYRNADAEQNPERRADLRRVRSLASLHGEENDAVPLAIRFALSNPDVSTVLIGFSDTRQVDEAVDAAERGSLPAETLARIHELQARGFNLS
jgi:aryl-alcohol dehydrogenase-like predicted oxidoreductase